MELKQSRLNKQFFRLISLMQQEGLLAMEKVKPGDILFLDMPLQFLKRIGFFLFFLFKVKVT